MGKPPGPHTSELQCLGSPACGTPLGHSSGGGVTIRPPCSQTPLVLVSIRIYFYKLVCGWLAASPCPHPLLPLPRQVSRLPSTPTVAQHHFSDRSCPGRQQGSSACTWCLARVPLGWPWRHIVLFTQRRKACLVSGRPKSSGNTIIYFYLLSGTFHSPF